MNDLSDMAQFADEMARDSRLHKDNELLRAEVVRLQQELVEAKKLAEVVEVWAGSARLLVAAGVYLAAPSQRLLTAADAYYQATHQETING